MPELALNCPYCNAQQMGFTFCGGQVIVPQPEPAWRSLWLCRGCLEGVVVTIVQGANAQYATPAECPVELTGAGFKVVAVHPKPQPMVAPEHVSEEIAYEYIAGVDSLRRATEMRNNPSQAAALATAAGMMFRKVLLRATTALATQVKLEDKTLADQFRRKNLKLEPRINKLADHHLITPAMRDWAHQIRDDGNEANHGEDEVFEQSDAKQMQAFTELFLVYAFTMPERVRLARGTSTNTDQSA